MPNDNKLRKAKIKDLSMAKEALIGKMAKKTRNWATPLIRRREGFTK